MTARWDVAVVGGGPAGSAAARAAARAGARTVLLERASIPRYKRCGGGLLALSRQAAGIPLDDVVRDDVTALTATLALARPRTRTSAVPLLRLVQRADLDARLVQAAAAAGAEIRTGVLVTAAQETADGVRVAVRGGDPVFAHRLVAADGANSRIADALGVRIAQTDLGLEGEFRAPPGWRGRVWLDWGPVPGSYAWLFPKGDTVTVGVIGDARHAAALRGYYRAAVGYLGLDAPLLEGGHHTRVRTPDSPLVGPRGRILLAGDAAGWLEPWTREGISFALRSGRLAGEAAAAGDPERYVRGSEAALGPEVAAGQQILCAYTAAPAAFHRALMTPLGWREFRAVLSGRTGLAALRDRVPVRLALAALSRWPRAVRGR